MRNFIVFIILILIAQMSFAQGLHIVFADGSRTVLGATPVMNDTEKMESFALDQAVVFASQLHKSFCIYRHASLDRNFDDKSVGESAEFLINIVADPILLQKYLKELNLVGSEYFQGYNVFFFNTNHESPDVSSNSFSEEIAVNVPSIVVNDNTIRSIASASCTKLDEALDTAFKLALSEMSKHQDINVKSMNREITSFQEQARLLNSENLVENVRFSEIKMFFKNVNNLMSYIVEITMEK